MSPLQIMSYVTALLAAGLSIWLALRIARLSGQKHYWAFLLFVLATNIVCLLDMVFRSFLWQLSGFSSSITAEKLDMLMGFVMVPLVGAFTILFAVFITGFVGAKVPVALQRMYILFWALLFIGFLAAEISYFNSGSRALTNILNPVFNFGILVGMVAALIFSSLGSRHLENPKEKALKRIVILYYFFSLFLFFTLNTPHVPINVGVSVLGRSLLGIAYNFPPLILFSLWLEKFHMAPAEKMGSDEIFELWLKEKNVSAREKEIIQLISLGKSNRAIEKELFISRRTVESHIYNVYKKLGVKNRLQLLRLVSERSRESLFKV